MEHAHIPEKNIVSCFELHQHLQGYHCNNNMLIYDNYSSYMLISFIVFNVFIIMLYNFVTLFGHQAKFVNVIRLDV